MSLPGLGWAGLGRMGGAGWRCDRAGTEVWL